MGGILLKRRLLLIFSLIGVLVLLAGCTQINEPITSDSKGFWNSYIVYPLSQLITYMANLTGENYGVAIIIVTLLIRLLILPLMIKQLRSTKAMQALQPELKKLREKYSSKDQKTQQQFPAGNNGPFSKKWRQSISRLFPNFNSNANPYWFLSCNYENSRN